jgi:hypothetical protein
MAALPDLVDLTADEDAEEEAGGAAVPDAALQQQLAEVDAELGDVEAQLQDLAGQARSSAAPLCAVTCAC